MAQKAAPASAESAKPAEEAPLPCGEPPLPDDYDAPPPYGEPVETAATVRKVPKDDAAPAQKESASAAAGQDADEHQAG